MEFLLGTHKPGWLARSPVPLMVSRRRLAECVTLPRAAAPWALDSGGFSELTLHGAWTVTPCQYVQEVRRWQRDIGRLQWAATQDWMCEPMMLRRTGLTVGEHQRRSVASYLDLVNRAPELPWLPVVQGQTGDDYRACVELYDRAGLDLRTVPLVGVGSVCRRQSTRELRDVLQAIRSTGVERLHGFGVKAIGLHHAAELLASADSAAWSFMARKKQHRMEGHPHMNCANCLPYALAWRARMLAGVADA